MQNAAALKVSIVAYAKPCYGQHKHMLNYTGTLPKCIYDAATRSNNNDEMQQTWGGPL